MFIIGFIRTNQAKTEGETKSNIASSQFQQTPSANGIKEIIIMKKTVLHLYPNGETHIQKHLGLEWIAGMNNVYKAKAKDKQDKKKDLEEIKVVEGESY